jgi:hypothetical protein
LTDEEEKNISELAKTLGLGGQLQTEFEAGVKWITQYIVTKKKIADLPEKPKREIRPRQSILEYIRAPDGLGPWFDAGVLTRPLILQIAPRAYEKLTNFLAYHELPEDIALPTRSDIVDSELSALIEAGHDLKALRGFICTTGNRLERMGLS